MKDETGTLEIERRLEVVRARIRRLQALRGAMMAGCVLLGGLLAVMAVDLVLAPTPEWARWVLSGAWLLAVGLALVKGLAPLFRKLELVRIARWLEGRHPEIEERMSTVLELSGSGGESAGLLEALAEEAGGDARRVDAKVEVKAAGATLRWRWWLAGSAGVMLVLLVAWPEETSRLVARAVLPFSELGNAGASRFGVKPGDVEVLAGDAVVIGVEYEGRSRGIELVMDFEDGATVVQPMDGSGSSYVYRLDPARDGFRYRVRAGRDESDGWTVTVWPMPEWVEAKWKLDYPAYTGRLAEEHPVGRRLEALVGTRVAVAGRLNTPVEAAWIGIGKERRIEGRVSGDGMRVDFDWELEMEERGEAVVSVRHRLGREVEVSRFMVAPFEDRGPQVRWLKPLVKELRVRPDESLELTYEAGDDFGLAGVVLEVGREGGVKLPQSLPVRVEGSEAPRYLGGLEVSVGRLRDLTEGAGEIDLRIAVEDGRPAGAGGPGKGYSEWLKLRIDQSAESLARQELRRDHEELREGLEKAIRATREARERMDWNRDRMIGDERNEESARLQREARERLAEAGKTLDDLVEAMEDGIHAGRTGEVREVSDLVEESMEDFEEVAVQEGPAQREAKLDEARRKAEEAVRRLEALRDEADRERPRMEDLARIEELAQRQQELARQAAAMNEAPSEEWRQEQKRLEEELRQQLRERPEAMAAAMKGVAEDAEALAREARELAQRQGELGEMAEAAKNLQESVREALAKEQAAIASELSNDEVGLPEAAGAAAKAAEAITEEAGELEAARAAEAALEQAAGGREEALAGLVDRQERVVEAVEAMSAGDPAGALEQLQAISAERAGALAAEVAGLPQLDGSPLAEAVNHSREGRQHAANAAESGEAQPASTEHGRSEARMRQAAESLDRAAGALGGQAEQAAQAAQAAPNANQAPVDPAALAEAFGEASKASGQTASTGAAGHAGKAAAALSQAARAGREGMTGQAPGMPGSQPGKEAREGPRSPQGDPGVPPELAKLGISVEDWEKIRSSLRSEIGAAGGGGVPEDYRSLVREYFESMAREK